MAVIPLELAWWVCPWPLQPSLAKVLEACISALPTFQGETCSNFLDRTLLSRKHLNALIKCLNPEIQLPVTPTWCMIGMSYSHSLHQIPTLRMSILTDSNPPHGDIVKLNEQASNALSANKCSMKAQYCVWEFI